MLACPRLPSAVGAEEIRQGTQLGLEDCDLDIEVLGEEESAGFVVQHAAGLAVDEQMVRRRVDLGHDLLVRGSSVPNQKADPC